MADPEYEFRVWLLSNTESSHLPELVRVNASTRDHAAQKAADAFVSVSDGLNEGDIIVMSDVKLVGKLYNFTCRTSFVAVAGIKR